MMNGQRTTAPDGVETGPGKRTIRARAAVRVMTKGSRQRWRRVSGVRIFRRAAGRCLGYGHCAKERRRPFVFRTLVPDNPFGRPTPSRRRAYSVHTRPAHECIRLCAFVGIHTHAVIVFVFVYYCY